MGIQRVICQGSMHQYDTIDYDVLSEILVIQHKIPKNDIPDDTFKLLMFDKI